jgi:hypothetical protein
MRRTFRRKLCLPIRATPSKSPRISSPRSRKVFANSRANGHVDEYFQDLVLAMKIEIPTLSDIRKLTSQRRSSRLPFQLDPPPDHAAFVNESQRSRFTHKKVDWSKAYRREHCSENMALECARSPVSPLAAPQTRPNSATAARQCAISQMSFYDWDPSEVYSPIQKQFSSPPLTKDSSTPFTEALPLAVDVPPESIGKADNYINELIVAI